MTSILKNLQTGYNRDRLIETVRAQYPNAVFRFAEHNPSSPYIEVIGDNITDEAIGTIVANHNPVTLTTSQQEAAQADSAKTNLKSLMAGLHELSASDKGFALYGRIFAARNGASQAVIDGITSKAMAQAYITGLTEWQNMTAASKAFFAKELEANAGLCTIMLVVLTS